MVLRPDGYVRQPARAYIDAERTTASGYAPSSTVAPATQSSGFAADKTGYIPTAGKDLISGWKTDSSTLMGKVTDPVMGLVKGEAPGGDSYDALWAVVLIFAGILLLFAGPVGILLGVGALGAAAYLLLV